MAVTDEKSISRKRRKWLLVILLLLLTAWIFRSRLERMIIAIAISRQGVFIPPPQIENEGWWVRFLDKTDFYWDVSALRVAREGRLEKFNPILKPIVKEIVNRQASGENMAWSMNIYREIRWRLNFTTDTAATRRRINDVRQSLMQPARQKEAEMQQAADGSWGMGIGVWYLRLYYSVDTAKKAVSTKYPLAFLDRINSPEKLKAKLDSDLYDHFTSTGTFNREELDETFSALARLLFAGKPIAYNFHPQLKDALRNYVSAWQNPVTGCWGQWMVDRKGRVWKMDDMAMTFHVVSDFHGDVQHKDLIAKHILQLDKVEFPAGIRFDGSYENHLNWDVVTLLRYAWPTLDTAIRKQARSEISKMLFWCLTKSLKPDGSFKISDLDDTLGDAYYYGVSFLTDAGYFDPKKRFWTNEDFSGAATVKARIKAKLKSIGLKDEGINDAYRLLNGNQ